MATRAIIGKVDRRGNDQAIYLGRGCHPDDAGAMLLERYSDAELIDQLIRVGAIARLGPTPKETVTYFRDHNAPWEHCQPYGFSGGTERFFAEYWSPGPEWLYVWTPDGWLASPAMPGAPPECYYANSRTPPDSDPEWREWLRRTREFQRPQPLHFLIDAYRAQLPGSGKGGS